MKVNPFKRNTCPFKVSKGGAYYSYRRFCKSIGCTCNRIDCIYEYYSFKIVLKKVKNAN